MFVKFTRLDGTPIWLNSTFVVTVEPRRGGGSVVVPIGDGLDYDVRESPEQALALLAPSGSAPQPEVVVAVPPPKALPEKFEDVVSQGLSAPQPDEIDSKPVESAPIESAKDPSAVKIVVSPSEAEPAPAKKTRTRKTKKAAAEGDAPAAEAAAKPAKKTTRTRKAKKAELTLDEAQVERLKRMMPGSIRKLQNTLVSQFKVADPEAEIKALVDHGVIVLENDHVVYP